MFRMQRWMSKGQDRAAIASNKQFSLLSPAYFSMVLAPIENPIPTNLACGNFALISLIPYSKSSVAPGDAGLLVFLALYRQRSVVNPTLLQHSHPIPMLPTYLHTPLYVG